MEFGIPTLLEVYELEDMAGLCRELGFQFVEINMNLPQYQAERLNDTRSLLETAKRHGIYYTIHLEENLDVCCFNTAVANAYKETILSTMEAAKRLGVTLLNMHLNQGIYITLPARKVYLYEKYKELYLQRIRELKAACENCAGDSGLMISIENTGGYPPFQKEAIEILLDSPVFCLTWDVGHSYTAGGEDEPYLLGHAARLNHFHIHDGINGKSHLILGAGEIDLENRLMTAKKCGGRCVIETKTVEALRQSEQWLRKRGWK